MNCTVLAPVTLRVTVSGAMLMVLIVFCVTVTFVDAIRPPLWAFTVAVPKVAAVSSPALLIVAMFVGLVLQVTCVVTSPVELLP